MLLKNSLLSPSFRNTALSRDEFRSTSRRRRASLLASGIHSPAPVRSWTVNDPFEKRMPEFSGCYMIRSPVEYTKSNEMRMHTYKTMPRLKVQIISCIWSLAARTTPSFELASLQLFTCRLSTIPCSREMSLRDY